MFIDQHAQQELIGPVNEWGYVPLTQPVMTKVNQLLSTESIQQMFHDATLSYEALKRWDIFRHFRDRIPKTIEPVRDAQYVVPCQLDGSDWRFCRDIPGRWPKYWDYCLAHACHWMTTPWLAVVNQTFPEHTWDVLSSHLHTGIICRKQKVIFDPYFHAVGVSVPDAIAMWKPEADDLTDCEYFPEGIGYSIVEGTSAYATRFWKLVETFEGTEAELIDIMNKLIDQEHEQEELGIESTYSLTDNDHFNQDPETLLVLASRADQYARN